MKVRRARQTAWRKIADETVLLHLEAKRMFGLSPTAAFVWQTLEVFDDLDAMLRALAGGGDPPFDRAELEAFLRQLVELGLALPADDEPDGPATSPTAIEPPDELEPPRILWQEEVEQIAATCAFMPGQSPLCNQVPMS